MKALYTQSEFKSAKSLDKLPLQCTQCGRTFLAEKHKIQRDVIRPKKWGYLGGIYCGQHCYHASRTKTTETKCTNCHSPIVRMRKEVKHSKTGRFFCSRSCAAKWNNAHKTKGTRVSKLEVWISKQLPELYPNLEFHFNRRDAINGELDIYIPALKLAFELNGIYHYEPIFGQNKLDSIQSNDSRKFQACIEKGIDLCIIDVSNIKYFKEQSSQKFLDIIVKIITGSCEGT